MRRFFLPFLLALAGCSGASGPAGASLPDLTLPRLDGASASSLASCATPKCLTIVVAPWCGYCRMGTPMFIRVKEFLRLKGVETRIVVSMADETDVRDYAREFGPDTLLDPANKAAVSGGVPHLFVSDKTGAILKEVPGLPQVQTAADFAGYLDLP